MKIGPGLDQSSDMGPSVDEKQWSVVMDYIGVGKSEGARLLTGGTRPASRARLFRAADDLRRRVAGHAYF